MSIHHRHTLRASSRSLICLPLFTLALGCSSEGVDLGGGTISQDLVSSSRCSGSPIIDEDVVVKDQEELAALAGCEEIRGGLHIQIFTDADLGPLASLRSVGGELELGASTIPLDFYGDFENIQSYLDAEAALFDAGWLESLSGVESLERVGALSIRGILAPDLSAFESLRSISDNVSGGAFPGALNLALNRNLVDLTGLENVSGLTGLDIWLNDALVSLDGLTPPVALGGVNIADSPALTDISALDSVLQLGGLFLRNTGLTDLSGLAELNFVGDLAILDNAVLADASGLAGLTSAASMVFQNNAVLTQLPPFTSFQSLDTDIIKILDNPALESVNFDFPNVVSLGSEVHGNYHQIGVDVIEIGNNAALQTITSPSGIAGAQVFSVHQNPSLTSIDLGSFSRLGVLEIDDNATLSSVGVGGVGAIASIEVTDNPQLSTAVFDGVRAIDRLFSGNADDPAP